MVSSKICKAYDVAVKEHPLYHLYVSIIHLTASPDWFHLAYTNLGLHRVIVDRKLQAQDIGHLMCHDIAWQKVFSQSDGQTL